MVRTDLFQKIEIFAALTTFEIEPIAALASEISLDDDTKILTEGDMADAFYIIVKGKVMVSKKASDGSDRFIAHLTEGDLFGEMSLLDNFQRSATVSTVGPVTLLKIEKEGIMKHIQANPSIGVKILLAFGRNLSKQMRLLVAAYTDLADKSIIPWSF